MSTIEPRAVRTTTQRPRLTICGPMLRGGGELHIVGRHEVLTVSDPDGAIHRLLELCDGSRSRAEVAAALALSYPLLSERELDETLRELEQTGLIEDSMPRARRAGCNLRSWGVESGLSRFEVVGMNRNGPVTM